MNVPASAATHKGSAYVLVVGLTALVMTLAVGAIAVARIQARRGRADADVTQARLLAHAAVEMGRFLVKSDPQWRVHYPNGTWGADALNGLGQGVLEGIDPNDADLTDDELDPLVLVGTGARGAATQAMQVTLLAYAEGYGCLQTALYAGNAISFNTCTVQADQIVAAGNSINASAASIYANAEAANAINGVTYYGTKTTGVAARSLPSPTTVFDTYQALGSRISRWALPISDGARVIAEVVLSPASNPFSPFGTNSQGVYYIECDGENVRIRNCRIVGTLVLRNAGAGSRVEGSVNWEPAVANYPALLVEGNMAFQFSAAALDELTFWDNFNPFGTPYQGQSDNDLWDFYPSRIKGLVYVKTNAVARAGTQTFHGVVIAGNTFTAEAGSVLNLRYDATYLNDLPPAFRERVLMKVADGSYERHVD